MSISKRDESVSLETLATRINEECRAFERDKATVLEHAESGLRHAINAGEMLSEVKASLNHGEWLPWLRENFEGTPRYAQMFMKLAVNRDRLNTKRLSHLSISGALRELEPPEEPEPEEELSVADHLERANEYHRKAQESKSHARDSFQKAQSHMKQWARGLEEEERRLKESYGQMPVDEYLQRSNDYQNSLNEYREFQERHEEKRSLLNLLDRLDGNGEELSDEEITLLVMFAHQRRERGAA